MPATFSRYFVESPGNTILAAHWNGEFDNILNNFDATGVGGASANLSAYQAVSDPGSVGTELLPSDLKGELQRLRWMIQKITNGAQWYSDPGSNKLGALPPIGSIIPFYDFNGALTFDTDFYHYADGTKGVTVGGVSRDLPDLSGRFLVGFGTVGVPSIQTLQTNHTPTGGTFTITFGGQTTAAINYNDNDATATAKFCALSTVGTDNASLAYNSDGNHNWIITFTGIMDSGPRAAVTCASSLTYGGGAVTLTPVNTQTGTGGDIGSASFATAAVGAAQHQVDISHTHTGPSHTHTGPSHTHIWAWSFSGTGATTRFGVKEASLLNDTTSLGTGTMREIRAAGGGLVDWDSDFGAAATATFRAETEAAGSGNTGASGTGSTSTGGSTTLNIQPRSVRVRFLVRVA